MASAPSSPLPSPPPSPPPLKRTNTPSQSYLSKTTAHITHINRLISTTANLDLTLSTIGYTLAFLSTILPSAPATSSLRARKAITIRSPKLMSPLHLPSLLYLRARLAGAAPRLKILSSLISETRTILRLFGLLSLFPAIATTLSTLLSPPDPPSSPNGAPAKPAPDTVSTTLSKLKLLAATIFQVCENLAFLGDKGILPIPEKRRSRIWKLCLRAWAAYVFLELGSLARQYHLAPQPCPIVKGQEAQTAERLRKNRLSKGTSTASPAPSSEINTSEEDKAPQRFPLAPEMPLLRRREHARSEEYALWLRKTISNAAYAPMTLHYTLPNGLLNAPLVSLCGVVASGVGLVEAWRTTTVEDGD
ncbi:MAG: hypothetical protein Q9174_005280 [Haloplaca sp. 1 TL-2023]